MVKDNERLQAGQKRESTGTNALSGQSEYVRVPDSVNANAARQMEAAYRTALLKGEVGIKDPARIPTVAEFAERFLLSVETNSAHKPRTIKFYRTSVRASGRKPESRGRVG